VILMAYCSECGAHYGDNDSVCSSCGRNLTKEFEPEAEETPSVGLLKPETEVTANFQADDAVVETIEILGLGASSEMLPDPNIDSALFHPDGHLGKGIIKPQKVELESDGVHFKYDTPSHSFIKTEPVKEKPREYRVTSSDMESNTADDVYIAKGPVIEELAPPIQENTDVVPETIPAWEEELVPNILADEDISLITEPETILEPVVVEPITEPTIPESEQKDNSEPGIIWEAGQTWFGIPRSNIYRVTGRSLIILGKYNNKLLEVSLVLITGVTLRQSWFAKLFGVGDLLITVPSFPAPKVVLRGISQPIKVKQILENLCLNKV
jgi:hypothetical protein